MRGCTPDDIGTLVLVGHPTVTADRRVVAVRHEPTKDGTEVARRLWVWTSGTAGETLTGDGDGDEVAAESGPQWSPDGSRLAYVAGRDGRHQAWWWDADGGASALAAIEGDVRSVHWVGPDRLVALVDRPTPDPEPGDPVAFSWLRYKKDGRKGWDEPPSELWTVTVGGDARRVVVSDERITAIDATGGAVAYVVDQRHDDRVDPTSDVHLLEVDGDVDTVVWACPSPVQAVAVGPDRTVVAVATGEPGHGPRPHRAWRLAPGSEPGLLWPAADLSFEYAVQGGTRPIGGRLVAMAGDTVVAVAGVEQSIVLVAGGTGDDTPRRLTSVGRCVTDFAVGPQGTVAVCLEHPGAPADLFLTTTTGAPPERLSELNADWLAEVELAAPTEGTATSNDGLAIPYFLYRPAGPGPHPLITRIHGGPHSAYGYGWDLETQIQVAAGFAVLLPNLRGSTALGTHFRTLTVGEWGGRDYDDLIACVDAAVAAGGINESRLYVTGGSYGGYLTNWTVTHTGRFRAAVSERSVSNLLSKYGTSDNGFVTNRAEMADVDLFDTEGVLTLLRQSPVHHAPAVTTPILLLHGEADQRCPIEQSEQFFVALRRLGKEAVFVRYPGEFHGFKDLGHRRDRLVRILEWFAQHQ